MLEARNLKKQFLSGEESFVLYERLDLTVREGEFVILTGRSGSGKSTLLYQLGLLDTPAEGDVIVDGAYTRGLSRTARTDLRLDHFGYVFQDYGLMPELSALDNVLLTFVMRGEPMAAAREKATAALDRVGLADRLSSKPSQLSGGQQQRVSIARAIAHAPRYVLADEPTANLDSASAKRVLDLFGDIHRTGSIVIMVTHELESLRLADHVYELHDGVLREMTRDGQSPNEKPTGVNLDPHSL
ncbi:ABC transporter ATP-binding protein [Patescibacteria group bacterium]|nr:ABC transporter ATP-binding protein [Patescibacteria group bacterium]